MKNENFITGVITSELIMQQMKADFDFDDYKHIHYTMFSDIYDWAGCIRTVSLSKSAAVFTRPEDIEDMGGRIFKRRGMSLPRRCSCPKPSVTRYSRSSLLTRI